MSDKETAYLQDLHASGIDVERLQESIRQLETGQVDTVALENLDDFLEKL
jgi:PHD/YefM family antitoxin component YafN of YafNO toxin-antitoxin module